MEIHSMGSSGADWLEMGWTSIQSKQNNLNSKELCRFLYLSLAIRQDFLAEDADPRVTRQIQEMDAQDVVHRSGPESRADSGGCCVCSSDFDPDETAKVPKTFSHDLDSWCVTALLDRTEYHTPSRLA